MKDAVIAKLKELRQASRMSIADVSAKMGFSSQMGYANIENGKTNITLEHLENLAAVFRTTVPTLMGLDTLPHPDENSGPLQRQTLLLANRLVEDGAKGLLLETVLAQNRVLVRFALMLRHVLQEYREQGSPGCQHLDTTLQQCADQWLREQLEAIEAADYDGLTPEENRRLREQERTAATRIRERTRGLSFTDWLAEYAGREYKEDFLAELLAKREEVRAFIARIQQDNGF